MHLSLGIKKSATFSVRIYDIFKKRNRKTQYEMITFQYFIDLIVNRLQLLDFMNQIIFNRGNIKFMLR